MILSRQYKIMWSAVVLYIDHTVFMLDDKHDNENHIIFFLLFSFYLSFFISYFSFLFAFYPYFSFNFSFLFLNIFLSGPIGVTTRGQLIYPSFTELGLLIPQTCAVDSCNQVSYIHIFYCFCYIMWFIWLLVLLYFSLFYFCVFNLFLCHM